MKVKIKLQIKNYLKLEKVLEYIEQKPNNGSSHSPINKTFFLMGSKLPS